MSDDILIEDTAMSISESRPFYRDDIPKDKHKYYAIESGSCTLLTQSLFYELCWDTKTALYTLHEDDRNVDGVYLPSIKRLYLEEMDLGEHTFANKYFASYSHWARMVDSNQEIRYHHSKWRWELEVKLRALGAKAVVEEAVNGKGSNKLAAGKWLATGGWQTPERGRPNKTEKARDRGQSNEAKELLARLDL